MAYGATIERAVLVEVWIEAYPNGFSEFARPVVLNVRETDMLAFILLARRVIEALIRLGNRV